MSAASSLALLHLAAGIGDIVLATPLIAALDELGLDTELALHADYEASAELFNGWGALRLVHSLGASDRPPAHTGYDVVIPAVPPFYWSRFMAHYAGATNAVRRPPDTLFYEDQQGWYLEFARALGYPAGRRPPMRLPVVPVERGDVAAPTMVLAPGCKTGIMAAKRWPHFAALAERFDDVAIVGTSDDLRDARGAPLAFPQHVRSYVDRLSLRQTAELIAGSGVVVANDSGLAHVAAALGTPTVLLFGPTPDRTLGGFPPNVTVLRSGLPCEPCWQGERLRACHGSVRCLAELSVERVDLAVRGLLGLPALQSVVRVGSPHEQDTRAVQLATPVLDQPLVSCIMPTRDRPSLVAQAVRYFQRQDWPNRELIVIDDGTQPVESLLPADSRVRYVRLDRPRTVGAKRNIACELAQGAYVAHWDDDDWMADGRLAAQVGSLLDRGEAVCGLARLLFMDPVRREAWEYRYDDRARPWVAGGTLCYPRSVWERRPFSDVREGEDSRFVWGLRDARVLALDDPTLYVATVHAGNTSRKHTNGARWHPYPFAMLRSLLGRDAPFYDTFADRIRQST